MSKGPSRMPSPEWKMNLLAHSLVIAMLLPHAAHAVDNNAPPPPPPPPNPFSNLPAGNAENFAPFDDEFEGNEGANSVPGATGAAPRNARVGTPQVFTPPASNGGGGLKAEGGQNPRLAAPATCKETVDNFDYPDAEILDVAKAIGKLTGRNFIYNPQDIKGRISVVSQTQITVCDAWNAFLTALNLKGFALVPSGKYLRIERIANAKEKQTPIYTGKTAPNNDEFITRVLPLRYIDATEFESAFRLWMPREARMQAYQQTNTIIITDTAAHINRMVELIQLLDIAGYQESLVVMPIRNAAAKDIAKLVETIINNQASSSSGGGFGFPGRPVSPYGGNTGRTKGRGGSTISKIIADDRTNALIVKANAAGIQEVRALVRRLDVKGPSNAEGSGKIHVYTLKFANAEELAKVLQNITNGSTASRGQRSAFPTFGEAPPTFQSEIKISPDKTTQSLVITASPQDYVTMKKVIERLDQPRDQVYLECMILETDINRGNSFGVSFFNSVNGLGLPSSSNNLQNLLLGIPPTGFMLGYKSGMAHEMDTPDGKKFNISSFQGIFELIQNDADNHIIANPQIVVLDNEKATFEVTEQIPVPTSTIAPGGTAQVGFGNDKATLSLEVTPQINKGSNFVKLEIAQKMEQFDASEVPSELLGKATGKNSRSTTTKVFVESDDTVVLSGMIRNTVSETIHKVPFLGDIPLLGWLFKNSTKSDNKTNLMVFITPRVIKQYDKFRTILANKLSERDEFVRETQGSIDPWGREINKLKRDLPDLSTIEPLPTSSKPEDSASFSGPSAPERDDDENDQGGFDPNSIPIGPPIENAPPFIDGGNFPGGIPDNSPVPVVPPSDPNSIPTGGM